jgi:hypothetical protein
MRFLRFLLFVALGIGAAVLVVLLLPTRTPKVLEQPAPPPAVKPPEPPLQADAEGRYVPGYPFMVSSFRFAGLTLHPDAFITFQTAAGTEQAVACLDAVINASTVHLRCDDQQVGTVTIDGRFLTRFATDRLDAAVLSAVVTVRSGSGEILYNGRDAFQWRPAQ